MVTFGNFHFCPPENPHTLGKFVAGIATVGHDVDHARQGRLVLAKHRQGTCTIGHIGRRHVNCVRQALRIHRNMPLDTRHLLARVIALVTGLIGILDALRVHDAKARRGLAPIALAFLLHLIFLKPAQAGWVHWRYHDSSTDRSSSAPCSLRENHSVVPAKPPHS